MQIAPLLPHYISRGVTRRMSLKMKVKSTIEG